MSEDIPLPTVERQDLIDCLTQLNQQLTEEGHSQIAPADLPTIADGMLALATADSEKQRLRLLYEQLLGLATKLRAL